MSARKPVTGEMLRILRAVSRDALRVNPAGRYVITDESKRPERRARELLVQRGYLKCSIGGSGRPFVMTTLADDAERDGR